MSLILQIDTAGEDATVSLSQEGKLLAQRSNAVQKQHAAFIHPAIEQMMQQQGLELKSLTAVSVNYGPGSYTGLRVGLAAAKGLCFALDKPLILLNALDILAEQARLEGNEKKFIVPMIDARRTEVFCAVYDHNAKCVQAPFNHLLTDGSFKNLSTSDDICFCGSGAAKFEAMHSFPSTCFMKVNDTLEALSGLGFRKLLMQDFADVINSEPFYLKEFFTNS